MSAVERKLSAGSGDVEASFVRAQLLWKLGRTEDAKNAYLNILTRTPTHFGALNNLGALLHSTGFRKAARTCYSQVVMMHPGNAMGHVNLANSLVEDGEYPLALDHFEKALVLVPGHAEAHQGLANLHDKSGNEEEAAFHRRMGFKDRSVIELPFRGKGQPVRVLLLTSATRGNAPIQKFLHDHVFHVTVVIVEYHDPSRPLPPHHLIVNAVGNADLCGEALAAAANIVARSSAPVVNAPDVVMETDRVRVADRLRHVEGVVTPLMENVPREILAAPDAVWRLKERGFETPFLLRSPGFNNGLNFFQINDAEELEKALESLPGREITVIQFLDARDGDGKIRKYRVMMIDGKIHPLHAAIARQWKIHYVTAEMADNAEHRAEDETFLNDMENVLGPRAMAALERICHILALDYGGIDFSLNRDGDVLLFEANATMNFNPPENDPRWTYRIKPVERILMAIRTMFLERKSRKLAEYVV